MCEPLPPEAFRPLKPGPGYISPFERERRLDELKKHQKPKPQKSSSHSKKTIVYYPPLSCDEQWINERIRLYKKWLQQVGLNRHCPRCANKLEFGFSVRCRWALPGVKVGRWICIHCHRSSELGVNANAPSWRRKNLLEKHPFCHYCNRSVDVATASVDHVHPKALGGLLDENNVVLACLLCNNEKGSLTASQYIDLRVKLYQRLELLS